MPQDNHLEEYQALTKRVESVKTSLSVLSIKQQEAQKSATAVLAKHSCKTVEEFEAKVEATEAAYKAAKADLEVKVTEAERKVSEIETALKN